MSSKADPGGAAGSEKDKEGGGEEAEVKDDGVVRPDRETV
jgi:hypothetical protein